MKPNLVIVESPAKAKTIEKYLGKDFTVKASIGHIKDLPKSKLGVDVDKNFKPQYEVIKGKKKVIDEIKKAAAAAENVYLAPDPDREGEAIAWHVAEEVRKLKKIPKIHRVLFNEITKKAIREAIDKPLELNQNMYEAQQARRVLDRLVGYQISPLLWEKVRRGLSAGRVQSVAVRLICDREAEVKAFVSEEYWNLEVRLHGSKDPAFIAKLHKIKGEKIELHNEAEAQAVVEAVKKAAFVLGSIQKREQRRNPSPPFITSKLQQEAARKLGYTAKKTMMLAQKLYEGVELGDETVGLITYMRTDSTRVADSAIQEVREYIGQHFGAEYLPEIPNIYKSKKGAQDAHEAIRPTSMAHSPDVVTKYLKKDELRLYELIWKRFIACQMKPAVLDQTVFVIQADQHEFRASGSIIKFPGFISVYTEGRDEETVENEEGEGKILPELKEGETLRCEELLPSQHFTQPPPRYTEASLVKELEEKGIGRPSTYASILSVIQDKKYAEKNDQKKFAPTELGTMVNTLLVENFPNILDVQFTARMESELDNVEEGTVKWDVTLKEFYTTFAETLKKAKVQMKNIKRQEIPSGLNCKKCGNSMIIKFGRHGEFLACSSYPECKSTSEFKKDENGSIQLVDTQETGEVCGKCGAVMIFKRGRFGRFIACSDYPNCKNTKAITLNVNCPQCAKPLSEKKTKKGKSFFGCTGYPTCQFASWDRPVNEKCPQCDSAFLVEKYTKTQGTDVRCPNKECDYRKPPAVPAASAEA